MKIMKIFGLVVGIHVVLFVFAFAIPGCRSTTRHSPPPPESVQAEAVKVPPAPPTPVTDVSPIAANSVDASNATVSVVGAPAPVSNASGSALPIVSFDAQGGSVVRTNPVRPGSPEAQAIESPQPQVTPASTHVVASGETLWKIAKQHGLTTKELAAANKLKPDAMLKVGQKIVIPGKAVPSSVTSSSPTSATGDTLIYRVKPGETLAVIAKRAGTTTATIKSLNHLHSDTVRPGQELTLPAGNPSAVALAASSASENSNAAAAAASAASSNSNNVVHHTVKSGETLGQIARHYGVSRRDLAVANNIADPLKLRVGQDLVIPNPKTGVAAHAPSTSETPAAAPTAVPANTNASPVAAQPSSPIAPANDANTNVAPASNDAAPVPPVVQVQDTNPVAAPK